MLGTADVKLNNECLVERIFEKEKRQFEEEPALFILVEITERPSVSRVSLVHAADQVIHFSPCAIL